MTDLFTSIKKKTFSSRNLEFILVYNSYLFLQAFGSFSTIIKNVSAKIMNTRIEKDFKARVAAY